MLLCEIRVNYIYYLLEVKRGNFLLVFHSHLNIIIEHKNIVTKSTFNTHTQVDLSELFRNY